MVRELACTASKAQKILLKQASALKCNAYTKFCNKFKCVQEEKTARG